MGHKSLQALEWILCESLNHKPRTPEPKQGTAPPIKFKLIIIIMTRIQQASRHGPSSRNRGSGTRKVNRDDSVLRVWGVVLFGDRVGLIVLKDGS